MAKAILITGASSGIGEETARALLAAGHIVYAGARRIERMNPLLEAGARALTLDVNDGGSMTTAVQTIVRARDRIDVLINNAGYGSHGALEDVPPEEARPQFDVNIFGMARLTQLVLPSMRAQRAGRIVNISPVGGKLGEPFGSWYHATKFAVEGLSHSLRMELRQFGIDVVIIQPGAIISEWNGIARQQLKTRYATGGGAKLALFLHRVLPDRAFDAMMLRGARPQTEVAV
jgi:NAD(P)-dependent dehydrogenase (short-subunit alcohol dehydrogenase family)